MSPEDSNAPRKRPRLRTHLNPREERTAPTPDSLIATAIRASKRLSALYSDKRATPHSESSEQPDDNKPTSPA